MEGGEREHWYVLFEVNTLRKKVTVVGQAWWYKYHQWPNGHLRAALPP
jgi:hypothetical protein